MALEEKYTLHKLLANLDKRNKLAYMLYTLRMLNLLPNILLQISAEKNRIIHEPSIQWHVARQLLATLARLTTTVEAYLNLDILLQAVVSAPASLDAILADLHGRGKLTPILPAIKEQQAYLRMNANVIDLTTTLQTRVRSFFLAELRQYVNSKQILHKLLNILHQEDELPGILAQINQECQQAIYREGILIPLNECVRNHIQKYLKMVENGSHAVKQKIPNSLSVKPKSKLSFPVFSSLQNKILFCASKLNGGEDSAEYQREIVQDISRLIRGDYDAQLDNVLSCYPQLINLQVKGQSLLHLACKHGSINVATVLLAKGLFIDTVDETGCTALHMVCKYNMRFNVAQFLINNRANFNLPNREGETPYQMAFNHKNVRLQALMRECSNFPDALPNIPTPLTPSVSEQRIPSVAPVPSNADDLTPLAVTGSSACVSHSPGPSNNSVLKKKATVRFSLPAPTSLPRPT